MKRISLNQVNKALKAKGVSTELVKGDGYFYFIGKEVEHNATTSVYVYRLNELSLDGWLNEFSSMAASK